MIKTYVYDSFHGDGRAYIYIWISKSQKVIYIGMTNDFCGTIGRAKGHFNHDGTFRKRFIEKKGYSINTADDLVLLSFLLPNEKEFTTVEKSYRESVELLVQKQLQIHRSSLNPSFDVVSWVRGTSSRTSNSRVIKIADEIVQQFLAEYPNI